MTEINSSLVDRLRSIGDRAGHRGGHTEAGHVAQVARTAGVRPATATRTGC